MDRKAISKMLKKDLIRELQKEKKRARRMENLIQARVHRDGLRKQVHEEMNKTEELRQKIAIQDMTIRTSVDTEKRKLTEILDKISEINKCFICRCNYGNEGVHRRASLKCGHLFGETCIYNHLKTNQNCPFCSLPATYIDIRVIIADKYLCTADYLSS
ncbi:RING finger protein PFF0165c [Drosophila gunungcola]|uniref:RING-type domain-containing protein n=1 Tax=Drosophila gunungcola TaxID=103775 RepID=A0A9P9YU30_9MUSC|nr:RING finger protein PFF0165c [Drosophila gunungcola]KAI8043150.1 hypothetical protein M5D96_004477 [Drosophila gunungcola]